MSFPQADADNKIRNFMISLFISNQDRDLNAEADPSAHVHRESRLGLMLGMYILQFFYLYTFSRSSWQR